MLRNRTISRRLQCFAFAASLCLSASAHALSDLDITVTATSADSGLEAGQTVTFDIELSNVGSSAAFDVTVTDTVPAEFTSCSLDNVVGGSGAGDLFAAGYTFSSFTGATPNGLDMGDTATLQISCDLDTNSEDNTTYTNDADVVWANSLGGSLFPAESASDTVSTASPTASTTIIATGEPHTSDATADTIGDPRPLVIGENVRYRMVLTIPSGVAPNAVVTGSLPTGLEFVPGSDVLVGLVSSSGSSLTAAGLSCASGTAARTGNEATDLSTLALDCVVSPDSGGSGSGDDPVFNLGNLTNSEQDPADDELVVVEFNASVLGDAANGTTFAHDAQLTTDNSTIDSADVFAVQVFPVVDITLTAEPTSTGPSQDVEFVVTLEHNGTSSADAQDISINHVIPAGLTYDGGTGITAPQAPAVPGTDTCSISGYSENDADPAGAGLTISFDDLAEGDVCEVRYTVSTGAGATAGQTFDNDADLTYSQLPGTGTFPNATGSPPGSDIAVMRTASETVTIDTPEVVKSIVSTSLTDTVDGTADTAPDPRPLAIGESARFRLLTQLPEGTATTVSVTDQLPDGLTYVAGTARIALVSDNLAITPAPAISCTSGTLAVAGDNTNIALLTPDCAVEPTGGPFTSGTDPVWNLGDLSNTDSDSDDEYVLIEFDAVVANDIGNQSGTQLSGPYDLIANGATITSNSVVGEVREPRLTLAAAVTPNPVDNRTDDTPSTSWDITLSNAGTTTAFQIGDGAGSGARVVLPVGLGSISNLAITPTAVLNGTATTVTTGNLSLATTNAADDTLVFDQTIALTAGSTVVVEFDAEVLSGTAPGTNLSGAFDVAYASLSTGSSGSGTRDAADQATGTGNTPITSSAALNDYRTEQSTSIDTQAEAPAIDVVHIVSTPPAGQGDGSYTLTYTTTVTNTGDVPLDGLTLTNDFDATFGAGNFSVTDVRVTSTNTSVDEDTAFDGTAASSNLLLPGSSTLPNGDVATIEIDLTVNPGTNLGPYSNPTTGAGDSIPSGATVNDNDSADVSFDEAPEIGVALNLVAPPTDNGDGSYSVEFLVTLENSGDVPLTGVQVTNDLATVFADATSFTVDSVSSPTLSTNGSFDGDTDNELLDGSDTLNPADTATISIQITVTPGADTGPYANTAAASGDSPGGTTVNDDSVAGTEPDLNGNDNPNDDTGTTNVSFTENPQIGLALQVSEGPVDNGDGTHTLTYRFLVENTGDVVLTGVQITDDLAAAFGAAAISVGAPTSATLAVNPGFNGVGDIEVLLGTDSLAAGASGSVEVEVIVTPGTLTGPFENSANAAGTSPATTVVTDVSDDAATVDQNGNGNPGDDSDPTTVSFAAEDPQIGLALTISSGPSSNGDGTHTLTYRFLVENTGDVALAGVQITDDLASAFQGAALSVGTPTSATLDVNASFDGATDRNLLAGTDTLGIGESGVVEVVVTVTPGTLTGPFSNTAEASGTSPASTTVTDTSDAAAVVDENGNGDPNDDSDPTVVDLNATSALGIAKQASPSTPNFNGTFTTRITLTVRNDGSEAVTNVVVSDAVATRISPATIASITNLSASGELTALNTGFDGATSVDLTDGSEGLSAGGSATLSFDLTYTPGGNAGPFLNVATVTAESAGNPSPGTPDLRDDSTDGTNPDPDSDGNASNNSEPTPISFTPGTTATIDIDDNTTPGSPLVITVDDPDPNTDPDSPETITTTITNDDTGEEETVELTETGDDTGVFTGELPTDFGQDAGPDNDGVLDIEQDDTVTATYDDGLTEDGTTTTVTDTTTIVGVAGISGNAWLDANIDNLFDGSEAPLSGWLIRVMRDGEIVAEVEVQPDGSYLVTGLPPGTGYAVVLVHPESGASFGLIEGLTLQSEVITIDQNLPIDPSGVVYDSESRELIPGVVVSLVRDDDGTPLPDACMLPGQQNQTTGTDGLYRFDLLLDTDPACPSNDTYLIVLAAPLGYSPGYSVALPPRTDALDPTGMGDPVQVGDSGDAPTGADSTDYFVRFTLAAGDPNTVWNHIPLDPASAQNFAVRLTKQVAQRTTEIGSMVAYTIAMENTTALTLPGVIIRDQVPPGFSYVEGSATTTAGTVTVSGARDLTFSSFDLAAGERRSLRYLLRVGPAATHGEQINTATPLLGPAPIGNTDTAVVTVTSDPDFEQTTIIGKVFNDRDGDGWQDPAAATGVLIAPHVSAGSPPVEAVIRYPGEQGTRTVTGNVSEGVPVPQLPGRYGINDESGRNETMLRLRYEESIRLDHLRVSSREGTQILITDEGTTRSDRGRVSRGTNGQQLEVRHEISDYHGGQELTIWLRNEGLEESGVPGVRLATVEGLLIETDAHGRYHIAGIDAGSQVRGRNFIVKLDPRTLPPGSSVTTENPRVKRLSQGLMNQFDFGVQLPEQPLGESRMTVKISEMFFEPGSATVLPGYREGLRQVAAALQDGAFVSLRIEAFFDPENGSPELARQRAEALIEALCELAGRDVSQQIEVADEPSLSAAPDVQWLDQLVSFFIAPAYAEGSGCLGDICRDEDGVPVMVIERTEGSVYPDSGKLDDRGRVDLIGERIVRLEDGGTIWATEDPMNLKPRLAVVGPTHLPVEGGQITANASFAIYTNYAAFIDQLDVAIYGERDADQRNALARFKIDTRSDKRNIYKIDWAATELEPAANRRLTYVVSAYDAQGRADRTHSKTISLVDASLYQQQVLFAAAGREPTVEVWPGEEQVYVFVPGRGGERLFEFTPHFDELGTSLRSEDTQSLDAIIAALGAADAVNVQVVGHTSTKPIAQHNRHLYEDNYALAQARAEVVADYFRRALGDRLASTALQSAGPDQPVADNVSEQGRAANRRAVAQVSAASADDMAQVHVIGQGAGGQGGGSGSEQPTASLNQRLVLANDLTQWTIPVYGSRVRVHGNNVGPDHIVRIQGERIPLDRSRRFAVEYLLPVGQHEVHVDVIEPSGQRISQRIPVTVDGSYRFLVALADFTASDSDVSGAVEPLAANDTFDDDMLVEGRLAFYLKGKVKGKYLITAQMDTQEEEIEHLFDDIHRKDARSLFRRLDPDRYYPVYGDDSTVIADVNSQGRMYARVDWDKSTAVWGNFDTGLTGNELIQYNRGLYGLYARYQATETTRYDDARTTATVFGSENQTALGHSEFLGTGGSLYYLRHTDILPGSDKVFIEVRDPATNRVISNQPLRRTADYEIDELQGRIILTRPLMQIAQGQAPSLITDGPLDGYNTVMLVDYEYVPSGFDANHVTYGGRVKHWVGDHVGVGVTYVEEGRAAEDYTLAGADVTLKAGEDSWLKLEYGTTEATQSERFFSNDGGLSFANLSANRGASREGDAGSVDLHINAADWGGIQDWIINAWYKDVDDQFSIARRDDGVNVIEYGVETHLPLGERWQLGARASQVEAEGQFEQLEAAVQVQHKVSDQGTATIEAKYVEEERAGTESTDAVLLAAQYEHQINDRVEVYAGGQLDVESDDGYRDNNQLHAGVKVDLTQKTSAHIEGRDGNRGAGILASLEHAINDRHTIYGTVTHSTDSTADAYDHGAGYASMLDNVGTNVAAGHRWVLNDRVNLFTEGQHTYDNNYSGVGHVFGLDYADSNGLHGGMTVQRSDLRGGTGVTDRTAYSASIGYTMSAIRYASKLEYREDRGAEEIVQWLSTNRLDYKVSESYRVSGKFNYGLSENDANGLNVGKLLEGSLGIAYRPVDDNRFNWLAKYTYLYDLQSLGQEDADTDRRLEVLSWEGVYKLTPRFEVGAKLARRTGEYRLQRDIGPWFEATANFAAARLRWHVLHKWDALIEGRWLELEETDEVKAGALISVERHLADHFKIGVGYNFTDFSDDLTNLDFDHKGWFVNAVGKY